MEADVANKDGEIFVESWPPHHQNFFLLLVRLLVRIRCDDLSGQSEAVARASLETAGWMRAGSAVGKPRRPMTAARAAWRGKRGEVGHVVTWLLWLQT
jgi:hypothetical protein